MKKLLAIVLLLSLTPVVLSAQGFFDRIYIGGGGGLTISNDYTNIAIQPMLGYRITEIFSVGILAAYEHSSGKGFDYTANSYGGGVFGRAEVPLFAKFGLVGHAEYSFLNSSIKSNGNEWSAFNNFLPVGVGIYTQSGRSRISLVALWDLFHLSQYGSGGPTLRASVTF
ncbi:MAG: hypothetical protein FWH39_01685 [Bacteroidales bacterium]|nr:hypothetical protein [Bacteroidales bacterium]